MSRPSSELYEFGPFRVDLERRLFTREHQVVPLPPKTFDLLVLLVQRPGHAFSISVLRKALGEEGARCVETVPKHGYRFAAEVRAAPAEPASGGMSESVSVMPRRGTRNTWLAGAAVATVFLVVLAFLTVGRQPHSAAVGTSTLAVPLTGYPGFEQMPRLSADGSRVAFSWNGLSLDNYDIYVKLAGPGEPTRLTTNPAPDYSPAWSPDGRFIAFVRFKSPNGAADLIVIPAHRGTEQTIARIFPTPIPPSVRPLSNLSWTPDGRWLAFGGTTSPNGSPGIWLITVDGSQQRRLTDAAEGRSLDASPVVSPDGRYLAFMRARSVGRVAIFLLAVTPDWAPSGTPRRLTADDYGVVDLAWIPDGRDLVFSSGPHLGLSRLAKISAVPQSGRTPEPEFLPFGEQATGISISATGRLVYAARSRDTALYEVALGGTSTIPVALSSGFSSTFDEHTPHYSPDGKRLAFASTRSGSEEIWIANSDGSNPLPVTSMGGPQCSNPQWSLDGRTILFDSRRAGSADLYLLELETGKITPLTNDPADEGEARWSRDGRWIFFGSNRTGRDEVWRMPAAGGTPTQITRHGGASAIESPDGFLYFSKDARSPGSIWRVPIDSGAEVRVVDDLSYSINFAVGETRLYFVALDDTRSKASIDFLDIKTGQRATLVRLDKPFWYGMTLSPDERSLVFSMVDSAGSNLMVVDKFR